MAKEIIEEKQEDVILTVKVLPNSDEFEISGINEWRNNLRIKVSSPAEKGKANQELKEELQEVIKSEVEIISGHKSPEKKLLVRESKPERISNKLGIS